MEKKIVLLFSVIFSLLVVTNLWFYVRFVFDRVSTYIPIEYNNIIGSDIFVIFYVLFLSLYMTIFIKQMYTKQYSKVFFVISAIFYIVIMLYLLFFKSIGVQGFSFNPFGFILDIFNGQSFEVFANILFFIPLGMIYSFYKMNPKKVAVFSLIILILIETIQYVFKLGFFDISDIETNLMGICIGYILFKYVFFKHRIK
ncbi:hypothetical protein BFC19_07400 [Brochothrix thermosphacta]|uniref:VanZ family protein n=2 Tax=Brochothrix thermosphacta TaxID=2756 RepID=UPI000E74E84E|nr:VanZ family protein [Brochothrix thermosphacta]ANZ95214.1 hypothetical protein BFC19_07400 [Brochothrix thermosphacta]